MVLRRPYAFLIKHFRLIHLVITALLAYIAYVGRNIYKYLNVVIEETVKRYDASSYINYGIFIFVLLALGLSFIIYWLLKYKNKPRKMYIFIMVGYAIISMFMLVLFIYMNDFGINVPEGKTLRMYRDILSIGLVIQYIFILFVFIRGLGFDIKKFNFASDAQELNMTASDSEEIEINTQLDTTNIARKIHKGAREFGYFFKEFRLYILIILGIVLIILGVKLYNFLNNTFKVYGEGEYVGAINYITVNDSYYTVDVKNSFVIVNFGVYTNGKREMLNVGNMVLKVGNKTYTPDKNICYKFNNLGNCYKKQYIENDAVNYILVYRVDSLNMGDTYLMYADSYDDTYKIKLALKENVIN